MDFFERQHTARKKTKLLVFYFVVSVILTVTAVNAVLMLVFMQMGGIRQPVDWMQGPHWIFVSAATLLVITFGSLIRLAQLSGGGSAVAEMAGGRKVSSDTSDPAEKRLINVVEEMSIASGVPVPQIYVLDNEQGINAFAAGFTTNEAAIAVTKGALDTLDRDELQGVIGHEFSHILNGDMRINVRLIGILAGIIIISQIGYFLLRSSRVSYRSSGSRKGGNPLPIIGLGLFVVGYIGLFFGRLIKAAISRERESLADASSVQFTRFPDGIARALWKIKDQCSLLADSHAEEMSHMCFGDTVTFHLTSLFATHPPVDERIRDVSPAVYDEMVRFEKTGERPKMRAPVSAAPAPAAAGVSSFAGAAQAPAVAASTMGLSGSVGNPAKEHIDYAQKLHSSLPVQLLDALHSPEGAKYSVYALLMGEDGGHVAAAAEYLTKSEGARAASEAGMVAELVAPLGPGARLPLLDMAMPALRTMGPDGAAGFIKVAEGLVMLDKEVSLFEFALMTILRARLTPARTGADRTRYRSILGVEDEARVLLSALAHAGSEDTAAAYASSIGMLGLKAGQEHMEPVKSYGLLGPALDKLAEMSHPLRKQLIEACTSCVLFDGKVELDEGELLRAVCVRLDCPMPPIIAGAAG
jgi:Zn-dependent protease with chaperone function